MIKKVYTMTTIIKELVGGGENHTYMVTRNYKNGKSRLIGRVYKTPTGCLNMVRHRNACHFDKYGSCFVSVDPFKGRYRS